MRIWNLGDKVTVTPEVNSVWCGEGVICKKYKHTDSSVAVKMLTGMQAGEVGGFASDELVPNPKYKVGDRLVVTTDKNTTIEAGGVGHHYFGIGTVVEVIGVDDSYGASYTVKSVNGSPDYTQVLYDADLAPIELPEVYLCVDEDGDWFAFEGSVDEIPDDVTEVYAPGRKLTKQARWV